MIVEQLSLFDAPPVPGRLQRRIPDRIPDGAGGWLWYIPLSSKDGAEAQYERNAALDASLAAKGGPWVPVVVPWEEDDEDHAEAAAPARQAA